MHGLTLPHPAARAACLAALLALLCACGERAPAYAATPEPAAASRTGGDARRDAARSPAADPRPGITSDMLEAYLRGIDREIALMRAHGTHSVSLSMHDEHGRQVAETAGLALPEYRGLRSAVQGVLYALMMHTRYAGAEGQARLARLEPHKREHAQQVLARDPYASLSAAERNAVQARLPDLRPQYDRYMRLAAIAD